MLNEDKLKLMTGIAMFEKREGKRIFSVHRYFRGDYISKHLFLSFFAYTFCYILGVMIWILYNIEKLLQTMNLDEVIITAKYGAGYYLIGLVIYLAITYGVYWRRYEIAKRGMRVYVAKLKRLEKRYEFQNRTRELTKGGSRHDGATRS
ncbi:MAG: hypothetical protein ACRDBO_14750 [Lachnospiraceae bacterium]